MEGQVLKAFDIQELFMTYEENHLELLLEDSYRVFKQDFKCNEIEKGFEFRFKRSKHPVILLLQKFSIVQIEKFIPYIDQMIRTYESRDLSVFQGFPARIRVGKELLLFLQQIVSGEKIWENKKDLI